MRLNYYAGIVGLALASGAGAAADGGAGLALAPIAPQAIPIMLAAALPELFEATFEVTQSDAARRPTPFGAPLAPEQLAALRGGTETVSNEAALSGLVSGNSAINVSTGANTIDGAAFANVSGIPIVIQNTGANVLIQNATIVNLQLK
jgi:hypothetical protein